jgi:hypothetical protein
MMTAETDYEFDLVFALPEGAAEEGALLDSLFEAGCDDGVVGLGAAGLLALGFTRPGIDAEAVISGAVSQALSALPTGTRLREVKPDLVSLADVAARLNVSRQAMQKRQMPPPSLGGLYRAAEMLSYLEKQPGGKVQEALASAQGWFSAAPGAQKINAKISLDAL